MERISDGDGGWADLCWQAHRLTNDGDPSQDYYVLEVYGSTGADGASGPRWAVIRAQLIGEPSNRVFDAWPTGTYDGDCQDTAPTGMLLGTQTLVHTTICGRLEGVAEYATWTHSVTWKCIGCVLPDSRNRALSLFSAVAVPQGTLASWDVYADIGA
ncbi:MAG TPA: hypothetical protein VFK61_08910 [Candidatus Limnocylindria bacterium]|nr:hypothetical protein [Candidatus Limnocylindria bacterium]